jgi:uncharacterized protein
VKIIDCLEFNPRLRAVDPYDEIAFLCVECARCTHRGIARRTNFFTFYRCYRATLRARLAIAHLLEPNPRTPEKWAPLARSYLSFAAADAVRLERAFGA